MDYKGKRNYRSSSSHTRAMALSPSITSPSHHLLGHLFPHFFSALSVASFRKGSMLRLMGSMSRVVNSTLEGAELETPNPESLKLSVVPDLLRYSVLSKTSPCIPRAISYSYQGKSLVLSLRYRTGGIGRANSERKSPPHPPGLSGTERHQTFCWKMDV